MNLTRRLFRKISTINLNKLDKEILHKHDKTQIKLLDEKCILVNDNDELIGYESKLNCHLIENIEKGMLHRAFSIFLFNTQNKLLLQQRSISKITYPLLWTNTCCSHPLFDNNELDGIKGIKRAAKRRILYELGISIDNEFNDFEYVTRIKYKSLNKSIKTNEYDKLFGEYEIDYILICKGDYKINENKNEINTFRYVSYDEMKQLLNDNNFNMTPWFELICSNNNLLFNWWSNLNNLNSIKNHDKIIDFS